MVTDEEIQRAFELGNRDYLNARIDRINSVLNEYGINNFYISYSGGKDSNVLSKLIDIAVPGNHIPRVFVRTGIELNAVVDFVEEKRKNDYRFHVIMPSVNVVNNLKNYGYPFKSKIHAKKVDLYQRKGMTDSVRKYIDGDGNPNHFKFKCPPKLKYQFTDKNKLRISSACCVCMKEEPLLNWERKTGFRIGITGLRQAEGGSRSNVQCLSMRSTEKEPRYFNPLSRADDVFMDWMIKTYDIKLPIVYYPPYNFTRTGCKGCPFSLTLQHDLDTLEKFFPAERRQCELIFGPVYDEYRRLNYRLCR